jgi:nuclear GTP-binding protein
VLKGVVRVEALSTPSEHIPALMERVKPLYLSRTYGVPLSNPDDPTQSWEPEDFLDKLARMKGRLLKGGEPDLDGVAKIVLSDWVRGRIPYFVVPPERPEELNMVEAKQSKQKGNAANTKGKGKVVGEEGEWLGVMQNLGSIMQKNSFLAEDVRPLEGYPEDRSSEGSAGEESDDGDEPQEPEEEALSWNDVYRGNNPTEESVSGDKRSVQQGNIYLFHGGTATDGDLIYSEASSEGESEESAKKEPRMKTNKVSNCFLSLRAFLTLNL